MKTRCFDHIDLRVKNMEAARKFYGKFLPQLGFVHERPGEDFHTFYSAGGDKPSEFFGFTEDKNHQPNGTRIAFWADTREEVDRLATLVDRLLTWSRAETGQATLAQEVLNLHELADEVVAHLGVLAEEKQQLLIVERAGTPRGLGDRLVLRQSLINLVDNAIKYSPMGGEIRVKVAESPSAVTIDVSDTGPGIAPDLRAQIFERYARGGRSRPQAAGTGLGLSISKWAVEVNGGKLTLEPGNGVGSTFRITLPRAGAARAPDSRRRIVA